MTEYKLNNCTVRMHGGCDPENVKQATTANWKKEETRKKRKRKKTQEKAAEKRTGA